MWGGQGRATGCVCTYDHDAIGHLLNEALLQPEDLEVERAPAVHQRQQLPQQQPQDYSEPRSSVRSPPRACAAPRRPPATFPVASALGQRRLRTPRGLQLPAGRAQPSLCSVPLPPPQPHPRHCRRARRAPTSQCSSLVSFARLTSLNPCGNPGKRGCC